MATRKKRVAKRKVPDEITLNKQQVMKTVDELLIENDACGDHNTWRTAAMRKIFGVELKPFEVILKVSIPEYRQVTIYAESQEDAHLQAKNQDLIRGLWKSGNLDVTDESEDALLDKQLGPRNIEQMQVVKVRRMTPGEES